jgi:hypothetical protein
MIRMLDWKELRHHFRRKRRLFLFLVLFVSFGHVSTRFWCHYLGTHPGHAVWVSVVTGTVGWFSLKMFEMAFLAARQIPQKEAAVTPMDLPAERVLVRGAAEPSAPSETLLRATVMGDETKAEELLRVVSGAIGEQD